MVFYIKKIHNSFWTNFLEKAKQMASKVLFVSQKKMAFQSLRAKIVMRSLATVNELKIIIFVLNYLTVLVLYTKTISVGG